MTGSVGTSPARVGGIGRVTGQQAYVADLDLEDVLHVKLVTVDAARGRIGEIDARAALDVPGVRLVMTAADLPHPIPRFGPQRRDRPVLAVGETKYHGEPVAAVAAETSDAAEEAARLVRVACEELPALHTLAASLADRAPLVQDPSLRPDDPHAGTNVLSEHRYGWGDLDGAMREADVVIDGTYTFPMVTQFAIEPHAFMAAPDGDGIAIWSAIQHPYWLQRVIADLVGLPLAKVRVIAPDPGGAFGGKQHAKYEPLLAFMALKMGRPVRLVLTLEETFQAVRRGAAQVRVRSGFRSDGTLVFREIDADYLIGAYADIADRTVAKGSYTSGGPYRCPATRIVARSVLSHTVPSTAFRGFGNPQQIWAVESSMDEAALQLGIDPLALRLKNLAGPGEVFLPDDRPADGDWAQTVNRAAELIGWGTPVPPGRGRGLAVGLKSGPTTGLSYSTVRLLADGSVVVNAGTSDMGQGARTIFAQIAAQELGAPVEWVRVVMGDTAVVPYDQQTSASRSSVLMGNSVLLACQDIQAKIRAMAARLESVEEGDIEVSRGEVRIGDRVLPIRDILVRGLGRLGGEVIGIGEARKEAEPGHPLGGTAAFYEFNCTAVEVEVDRDTGDIVVARYVTVSDVGKALNPTQVRGQDEGAAIMGLGHTLMEQYIYDVTGRLRNLGAIDYRIPTSMDLPLQMESDIVENDDGPGPYGAKGMSEGALLPVAPAVAAAVRDAVGVVIRDLPLTPERVWRALQEAQVDAP
ncbi:MAG: Xanthine dehydrogenase, molybdenum binding subunit apoprotein [Chloroflexota bacterium]|nr:Xanthine dehydrogenase, molybdenum binding subunit apoprotein [Chloroflexota bacterium]